MALQDNELFNSRDIPQSIRQVVKSNAVADFAAGTDLLLIGTPVVFNRSTSFWEPYSQPNASPSFTLTSNATPATAGTFDLLLDGLVVEIDFDATAAEIQAEVNAMLVAAGKDYIVAAVATAEANLGVASAIVTVTLGEAAGAPDMDADMDDLTGNAHVFAIVVAGSALNGTNRIRAFVCHEQIQLLAAGEVKGTIQLSGEIHRDDVNTEDVRDVLSNSPSEAELDTALRDPDLRAAGIHVRGLTNVPR